MIDWNSDLTPSPIKLPLARLTNLAKVKEFQVFELSIEVENAVLPFLVTIEQDNGCFRRGSIQLLTARQVNFHMRKHTYSEWSFLCWRCAQAARQIFYIGRILSCRNCLKNFYKSEFMKSCFKVERFKPMR